MAERREPSKSQIEGALVAWEAMLEEKSLFYLASKTPHQLWSEILGQIDKCYQDDDESHKDDSITADDLQKYCGENSRFYPNGSYNSKLDERRYGGEDDETSLWYSSIRVVDHEEEVYDYDEDMKDCDDEKGEEEEDGMSCRAGITLPVSAFSNFCNHDPDVAPASIPSHDIATASTVTTAGGASVAGVTTPEIRLETEAAVFLTASLDYLVAEVLELSGNEARRKETIETIDITNAILKDENMEKLWTSQNIPPYLPNCLQPASVQGSEQGLHLPIRIDIYWRAIDWTPGGNSDFYTARYRLEVATNDRTDLSNNFTVRKTSWRNGDGVHYMEDGTLTTERQNEIFRALPGIKAAVATLVTTSPTEQFRPNNSGFNILDTTSHDFESGNPEWSEVEVLVYNPQACSSTNPFFRLRQVRAFGPQWIFGPSKRIQPAMAEQVNVIEAVTEAIGVGRPEEYLSDSKGPAVKDIPDSHELPSGIPYEIHPQYFLY